MHKNYDKIVEGLNTCLNRQFSFCEIMTSVVMSTTRMIYAHRKKKLFDDVKKSNFEVFYLSIYMKRREIINFLTKEFDLIFKEKDYRKMYMKLYTKDLKELYTLLKLKGYE